MPNYGHDLIESDAFSNLISFLASILNDVPRPKYSWSVNENSIEITTDPNQKPASIKLWSATNEESRDFRIDVLGPKWTSSEILINESGKYEVDLKEPAKGFSGYFGEITYPGEEPIKFTTGVEVLPKTYPFEEFKPEVPKGSF